MKIKRTLPFFVLVMLGTSAVTVSAQSGGPYTLTMSTMDGGGGLSAGGTFSVVATVGQPDVGTHLGAGYHLIGGFWAAETAPINSEVDTDQDGIPDDWEIDHGLNPGLPDSLQDNDGDGLTNREEYIADTHPLDAYSYLRLDIAPYSNVGSDPIVRWMASPNRVYQIWMRNDLSTPWVDSGFGIIRPEAGVGPSPMRAEFEVGPWSIYKLFGVRHVPIRTVFGVGPSPMRLFRLEAKLPPPGP